MSIEIVVFIITIQMIRLYKKIKINLKKDLCKNKKRKKLI